MTTWLTVAGAAEYIKAGEKRIRAAIKSGDLVAYAHGAEIRLTADDIDAWLMATPYEPPTRGAS